MAKPKIALYWCSSCGGCEESVIDLAEDLLTVAAAVDIVFWPVAIDSKYKDVLKMNDGEITATLINGAIRMDEQEQMAKILRKKSKLLIAHGSCAHLGGIVGLANFYECEDVLTRTYRDVPTTKNPQGILPKVKTIESGRELRLPGFHDTVKTLDQVVNVDYYIPGCPPTPELIKKAIMMVLEDRFPPKGSVLAEKKALCDTCPRREGSPDKLQIKEFKRLYETEWDPTKCFLDQGIICLGPATRGGCGARCINANMPCRGCFGPTDNVRDQGAKSLSFLASIIDSTDEEELKKIADSIPDPAGLFYRYSLASSMLKGKAT
ncbi:MAG: oxidoreductase [Deltaproteobacteria bacterium]|nr:oxidoreductase [Deltaproteobacteria bacterium]MBW2020447.1 oxidoreductase [Deltaproteobacteria bacterium]MBW2074944.1 oxidoreductase [Deltaproteobacteria bacterium]